MLAWQAQVWEGPAAPWVVLGGNCF